MKANMEENLTPLSKSDFKKLFPNLARNTEALHIYLYLEDLLINPDEIVQKVNFPHHRKIKIGESVKRGSEFYTATSNSLSYRKDYSGILVPEVEIEAFFEELIIPNKEYFKNIFQNCSANIYMVFYYYHSNNIGIILPPEAVQLLSEFKLGISYDLYCLYEDEESIDKA